MNETTIAMLDWRGCDDCKHYQRDRGGCKPLDEKGDVILRIDLDTDEVLCQSYEIANS